MMLGHLMYGFRRKVEDERPRKISGHQTIRTLQECLRYGHRMTMKYGSETKSARQMLQMQPGYSTCGSQ